MHKLLGTIAASVAIVAVMAFAVASASAQTRDAPRIMLDPAADNTDLHAVAAPDAPLRRQVASAQRKLAAATSEGYGSTLPSYGKSRFALADDPA
jgi:hypothetical protein